MNDELNGKMMACQLLIAGLVARVANEQAEPLAFITDFRDEMRAVARGIRLNGVADDASTRAHALRAMDELFALMKPPSDDPA